MPLQWLRKGYLLWQSRAPSALTWGSRHNGKCLAEGVVLGKEFVPPWSTFPCYLIRILFLSSERCRRNIALFKNSSHRLLLATFTEHAVSATVRCQHDADGEILRGLAVSPQHFCSLLMVPLKKACHASLEFRNSLLKVAMCCGTCYRSFQ